MTSDVFQYTLLIDGMGQERSKSNLEPFPLASIRWRPCQIPLPGHPKMFRPVGPFVDGSGESGVNFWSKTNMYKHVDRGFGGGVFLICCCNKCCSFDLCVAWFVVESWFCLARHVMCCDCFCSPKQWWVTHWKSSYEWANTAMKHYHSLYLKLWYPPNTSKWSFLIRKLMVVGETHHFKKPPYLWDEFS